VINLLIALALITYIPEISLIGVNTCSPEAERPAKKTSGRESMNAISNRLIVAGLVAAACSPRCPQRTAVHHEAVDADINDVTYEYFKQMKAGIEKRSAQDQGRHLSSNQLGQLPAVSRAWLSHDRGGRVPANGFWSALSRVSPCSMAPACSMT